MCDIKADVLIYFFVRLTKKIDIVRIVVYDKVFLEVLPTVHDWFFTIW